MIHHTAGGSDSGDIRIVRDGRSDLPGPLSQLVLKRNGDPHIIAVGVCWHGPGTINYRGVAPGNGNWYSIGIEGVSNGYNDWTPEQRANYPRVVAALLKDMNLPSDAFIFHRDYQPGQKIDPGGFTREWFQAEVNRHYATGGKPPAPVKSAIQGKRDENDWLGNKTSEGEELVLPDGIGRATFYQNGAIYFEPTIGAKVLSTEILQKWADTGYESGELGYPITDVFDLPNKDDGRAVHFQKGSIYWSSKYGPWVVRGAVKSRWAELDYERSYLGMPKSDEKILPDKVGVVQDYHGGVMYFSPATGANPIIGLILEAFRRNGYEGGVGYAKGGEIQSPANDGVFQIYEFAHAYYKWGTASAFFVDNDILDYYGRMGYESGRLQYPISDKYLLKDNIWRQDFVGGSIEINRDAKSVVLIINGSSITL